MGHVKSDRNAGRSLRSVRGLFLALALALLAGPGRAAPARDAELAAYLGHETDTPNAMLKAAGDRVVVVSGGAGHVRVVAWAPLSVEPETLRREMERALGDAGYSGVAIVANRQYGHTRAEANARRPRPLAFSGEQTLRYGALVAAFRREGHIIHAAAGHRRAAQAEFGGPLLTTSRWGSWRDVRDADAAASAVVRARLSPAGWALGVLLALLPFALLAALGTGLRAWLAREGHPVTRSARLLFAGGVVAASGVATLAGYMLLQSRGEQYVIADLWLGRGDTVPMRNALMAVVMAALFGWMALNGSRTRLLAVAATEPWRKTPAPDGFLARRVRGELTARLAEERKYDAAVSAEERSLRTRLNLWRSLIQICIFTAALVAGQLPESGGTRLLRGFQWPLALAGAGIVELAFKKRLAPFEVRTPDAELTKEAQTLGLRLGVIVREAEVDDTWAGRTRMTASFRKGRLLLSRRALRELTAAEREYILLKTLTGARDPKSLRLDEVAAYGGALVVVAVVVLVYGTNVSEHAVWAISAGAAALVGTVCAVFLVSRRAASRAHARALALTHNPDAARGARAKWSAAQDGKAEPDGAEVPAPAEAAPARAMTLDSALGRPDRPATKGEEYRERRFKRR